MSVAEAEFAFRLARDLPGTGESYAMTEVLSAVDAMHLAIEVPDSRYEDFTVVGAPQLIADDACACWFVLGGAAPEGWRDFDLAQHNVYGFKNHEAASSGSGANVLGDPRLALTWIANEVVRFGDGLRAGDVVTTGTCIQPIAVQPGDHVRMDFGVLGAIETRLRA
jgi:2-keto-4-pentenoate hydratase